MKKYCRFLVVFLTLSCWISHVATAQVVNIPDANLKAALRELFEANDVLGPNEPITKQHMELILSLNLGGENIKDLTGLEHATQLERVNLNGNKISNLSPLAGLTQLEELHFQLNGISNLNPVAGLTQLRVLDLSFNKISDVRSLARLTQLERLELWANSVSDVRSLAGLTQLERLNLAGNKISDVRSLAGLTQLVTLFLGSNEISDVRPLARLTQLRALDLIGNKISDVRPLAGLTQLVDLQLESNKIQDVRSLARLTKLVILNLFDNQIRDVSPLAGLVNLEQLFLGENPIQDTAPLASLKKLVKVDVKIGAPPASRDLIPDPRLAAAVREALGLAPNARITQQALQRLRILDASERGITDLSGLEHATQLRDLNLAVNRISDIRPIKGLMQLRDLNLGVNRISDIAPLSGLTQLTELGLYSNQIRNISPITGLTELTSLWLDSNQIRDITPLRGLKQLTALWLSKNQISNVSPLAALPQLRILHLSENQIRNITPLAGLVRLRLLYLHQNQIRDISPIMGMTQMFNLGLTSNQIRDIRPLTGLTQIEWLWLGSNQIRDIRPLAGLVNLKRLSLAGNPIQDTSPLASLTKLAEVDVKITAPSVIPDSRLAAEVREALDLAPNAPITKQTLRRLTVLSAGNRRITNLTGLEHATQLEELSLGHNQISDIRPLTELTQLRRLFLGSNQISDISPLAGLTQLRKLSLSQNNIRDVRPLAGLVNLERLLLVGNPIQDTSPLASLTKLVEVDIKIVTPVSKGLIPDSNLATAVREALDLAPNASITKQALQKLTFLAAVNRRITSLTGLEHATELKTLLIPQNQIRDINPLSGLTNLRNLSLSSNQINDIRPLTGLTQLDRLVLAGNQIRDVRPLTGLTQLERLYLYDNQISDVSPLTGLTRLKELQLQRNDIGNVSALAGLVNLEKLVLADNQISDVRPLAGLTRLKELWLHRNEIRDVSALARLINLEWLGLAGNPIQDTSSLASLTKLITVDVKISKPTSVDASVDVLIYTGGVWWITRSKAIAEAETTKGLLQSAGIRAEVTENENYVKQWMLQTTSDGSVDVLILYGLIPTTIYPPGNAMPDGSVAENWIETPDGNTILNHADYLGFWSTGNINLDGQVGERNGGGTLRNLMDIPNISIPVDRENIPMFVTTDGRASTSSLVNFRSNRPFPLNQLQGDWFAEQILASDTGNARATLADPVVIRDGDRGRIAIVHQTFFEDNPKGEVAAEIIINYLLADPVVSISPSLITSLSIGEQVTLNLNVTAGKLVAGYQVTVQFDPTALRYVESSNGDYLPTGAFFVPPIVNRNRVKLASTALTGVSNGDGTLATLTFEVVAAKASRLTLSDVIFSDNDGNSVSPQVVGGQVTEPPRLREDVNKDGVVNIQDLVLVASNFGQMGENVADVNGDSVVNITDLVKIAGALGNAAAAPSLSPQALAMFTTADVRKWLTQAQHLNLMDVTSQRGIRFLEQLLAALIPKETVLLPNYPNPFNPETWIPYQLAKSADVTLTIYAMNGQVVRRLALGHQLAGTYRSKDRTAYWDGRNTLGEPVASGVYFYTLTAGDFTATRKMLIRK